jgi:ectoine hydroxylase-related dioxygenase (phytanoyl-CoA dioxygenase family)
MMRANKVNIFYDQLLIKEPGTVKRTPWHHDMPYWPLVGWQVCAIWLALDPVTKESGAVEYVRGSHQWGIQFNPTAFAGDRRYEQGMPQIPDLESMRHSLQLIQDELAGRLHGAPRAARPCGAREHVGDETSPRRRDPLDR